MSVRRTYLGIAFIIVLSIIALGLLTVKPLLPYSKASLDFFWNYSPRDMPAARNYYHILSSFFSVWTSVFGIFLGIYYFYAKNMIEASAKRSESVRLLAKDLLAQLKDAHFDIMSFVRSDPQASSNDGQALKDKFTFCYSNYNDTLELMADQRIIEDSHFSGLLRVYSVVDKNLMHPPKGTPFGNVTPDEFLSNYMTALEEARRLLNALIIRYPLPPTP